MECCDFSSYEDRVYNNTFNPKNRFFINIMITEECNFRCTYCFERNKCSKFLELDTAKKLIDKMFDFSDYKDYRGSFYQEGDEIDSFHLEFFGGEPFLKPKLMEEILDYFYQKCDENPEKYASRKKNTFVTIITNGSLIRTKEAIHFIDKYIDVLRINITYEGVKEYHDSCRLFKDSKKPTFDVVDSNVKWYIKTYNRSINTKITITHDNLKYLYQCYKNLVDLGEKHIYAKFVQDVNERTDEDEKIADEQFRLIMNDELNYPNDTRYVQFIMKQSDNIDAHNYPGCSVRRGTLTMEVDGDFHPCYKFNHLTQSEEVAKEMVLGNVDTGISEHGEEIFKKLWKWGNKKKYTENKCKQCTYPQACTTCPGENLKQRGDFSIDPSYDCRMLKIQNKYTLLYNYLKEQKYGKSNKN